MKTSKTGPRLKKPGGEGLLRASPFLLPSLIGLAIFYLAPMVVSIFISLTDWNGLDRLFADGFMQEHFIGLDNYKAILTSQEFWKVLKNTLLSLGLKVPAGCWMKNGRCPQSYWCPYGKTWASLA